MNDSLETRRVPNKPVGRRAVVVTGASSGIGRACTLKLARAGFHVFAGIRKDKDAEALEYAAPDISLTPLFLDVTDPSLTASAVETVAEAVREEGLAGLVNNAGVGVAWPLELVPVNELRHQFEVNVFGQLSVTQAFLPLIRAARGRIINIGSVGGWITMPFGGPLCASKHALKSVNDALRMELYPWGIRVSLVEPGAISTRAVDKLEAGVDETIEEFPAPGRARYADAFRAMTVRAIAHERAGSPPEVVAEAVLHAMTAKKPKARYPVGAGSRLQSTLARVLPDRLLDQMLFRALGLPAKFGAWQSEGTQPSYVTRR
jgi:NAD(P)-dependent dehydrogenase (short-subunit alcohol dehydrogenase family)